jgi:serine/threonine-protein kinase
MGEAAEGLTVTSASACPTPGSGVGAAPPAGSEPQRIGKYEIVKLLGRGGMGAVYQAHDPLLERDVALKVMLPTIAEDPELKQRFEREARAVARLMHPAVVTLFDLGYHSDGSPYIVMELLRGRDLVDIMRHGPPLPLDRKLSILQQVLDGLGHAHKAGIVHRDIKPANVFVTEDGAAKIMDFGIARFMFGERTGTGAMLGTANYMSPEQVHGDPIDGRSDLFSVGTLFCELLTGRRPFDADTMVATLFRIANAEPDLGLPPGPEYGRLEPVLRRALARRPSDRFADAAEFAAALQAAAARPAESPAGPEPVGKAVGGSAKPPEAGPGTADPRKLFRLLREVQAGGKSGHLHITIARQRKTVAVLKGQIVYGTSDTAGEHLGDLLVERGLLGRADLERAVPVVLGERKRLGAVLVERGLLDRARLVEAIGLHARGILIGALGAGDASFSFEELSEDLLEAELACAVSAGQVILEATRELSDPDLVRSVLGDTSRVLRLSADPLLRAQKLTLTPAEGFVLSRIDGTLSAREVVGLIPLPAEETEHSLFSLLCTGMVGYEEEDVARSARSGAGVPRTKGRGNDTRPPSRPATTVPQATPRPPITRPAPTVPEVRAQAPAAPEAAAQVARGTPGRSEETRRLILETHAKLKLDHFEVLGLERSATTDDVRAAYSRLARVLHPDACPDPGLDDLREMRQAAFIRISEACEALRDPKERARYEEAFAPRSLRRFPNGPTFAPATAATASPPATGPAPSVQTQAAQQPRPAPSPPLAADTPTPGAASSPPRRASEARASSDTAAAPGIDQRLEPGHVVAVAKKHFENGQYWDAIQQLEPLVERVEDAAWAEAMLLLAQAYLKNPHWKRRAEGVLQSILASDPSHVPTLLLLAQIYAEGHLVSRARALYRKVLKLSPGNTEAAQAVAALEETAEKPKPAGGGLRRLLGIR